MILWTYWCLYHAVPLTEKHKTDKKIKKRLFVNKLAFFFTYQLLYNKNSLSQWHSSSQVPPSLCSHPIDSPSWQQTFCLLLQLPKKNTTFSFKQTQLYFNEKLGVTLVPLMLSHRQPPQSWTPSQILHQWSKFHWKKLGWSPSLYF